MTRLHHWQTAYAAFMAERLAMPFAWGTNDCAIFAADCVLAITGVDVALPELRGHTTELQAARVLKAHGGVVGIATSALGEPVSSVFANVGDVVLCSADGRDMLAMCNGSTAMAPGPRGLVPVAMGAQCWRVG